MRRASPSAHRRPRPPVTGWLAASLVAVGACGGETTEPLPPPVLERLELRPTATMPVVEDRFEIAVVGVFPDGTELPVDERTTWTIEDRAVVEQRVGGAFRALSEGTTRLTATIPDPELSAEVTITVLPSPLESLLLNPTTASIEVGEVLELRATGVFADRSRETLTEGLSWRSSDPEVVRVDVESGAVTGVSPGAGTVTAVAGDLEAEARVTVRVPRLAELELLPLEAELAAGDEARMVARARLTSGATLAYNQALDWSSSDPAVVTVGDEGEDKGLLRARSAGRATIRAVDPGSGIEAARQLAVAPPILRALEIAPGAVERPAGESIVLSALGVFSDGSRVDLTRRVAWRSSDPAIAAVNDQGFDKGLVSTRRAGEARIDVRDPESGFDTGATGGAAVITVLPPVLVDIAVEPRTVDLPAGLSRQLRAEGRYSDGSTGVLTSTVRWLSSSPMVAEVSGTGELTALVEGRVTVTASDPASGISSGLASAEVTVLPPELLTLALDRSSVSMVVGQTDNLQASGDFTDGVNRDVSGRVGWASSDRRVITVSPTGGLTAVSAGTSTVTALDRATGLSARAVVGVVPLRLLSIDVDPASLRLPVGAEAELRAQGTYNDQQVRDLSAAVTWSSSSSTVAAVDGPGNLESLLRALAPGRATITARDPSTGLEGRGSLEVLGSLRLRTLEVSLATTVLRLRGQDEATALGTFSDGNTYDLTHAVQFASSSPTIVEVSNAPSTAGRLRGLRVGTSTITATESGSGVATGNTAILDVQPGEVSASWSGPTRTVDGTVNYGVSVGSVTFSSGDFGGGATPSITDVDVRVDFLKTDGTCANPASGNAFHNETNFRLRGPGNRRVILAPPRTWSGSQSISPVQVTFDQQATGRPSGVPQTGRYQPATGNLNDYNGTTPIGTWVLEAGDTAGADPLCVRGYTITVTVR